MGEGDASASIPISAYSIHRKREKENVYKKLSISSIFTLLLVFCTISIFARGWKEKRMSREACFDLRVHNGFLVLIVLASYADDGTRTRAKPFVAPPGVHVPSDLVMCISEASGQLELAETEGETLEIKGLETYTNYSVSVAAFTRAGRGTNSAQVFCMTEEDGES